MKHSYEIGSLLRITSLKPRLDAAIFAVVGDTGPIVYFYRINVNVI
jgi:hypothetical protein